MKINSINFAQKVSNFIEKSPKVQKILEKVDKNPALFNSAYTAGLALTLKPASILMLAVNTKDGKEDAKYAASKSVSTGILDFLISLAIFIPLNKRLDKVGAKLFDTHNTIYFKDKQMCANYKSIANRVFKIATLPVFAVLKFGAIEPFVKIMFKNNKKEKYENNINK